MLISLATFLFSFWRKVSWSAGIFLLEMSTFCLLARKLLVLGLSILQIASLFTKNAHHRNHHYHLTSFCSFDCNFISPHIITRGCSSNFDWKRLSRRIDSTKRLIYFKILVYTKYRVAVPSFLFTVGISQTLLWIGLNWEHQPYKFRTEGLIR